MGQSALHVAASQLHPQVVSVLLKAQAQADARDHEGLTPARQAVARCHREVEMWRVCLCLDVLAKACEENLQLVGVFTRRQPDCAAQDDESFIDEDRPPLMASRRSSVADRARNSICEIRPNLTDSYGPFFGSVGERESGVSPSLINATKRGDLEKVRLLLRKTADPNCKDPRQQTALHVAAAGLQTCMLQVLLKARADPLLADAEGLTPLRYMIKTFQVEVNTDLRKITLIANPLLVELERELDRARIEMKRRERVKADCEWMTRGACSLADVEMRTEPCQSAPGVDNRALLLAIRTEGRVTPTLWDDL